MFLESPENFGIESKKKTQVFGQFALANIFAMRLLRKFGLLRQLGEKASAGVPRRERFARGLLAGKERSFRNIAEHSLVVAIVADTLLERAEVLRKVTPEERKNGVEGALFHDLTKRMELEARFGGREAHDKFISPPDMDQKRKSWIAELKVSDHLLRIIELSRLSGEGIISLREEQIQIVSPSDLIRFCICIADYLVSHTSLTSIHDRLLEMSNRGEYGDLLSWSFDQLFPDEIEHSKNKKAISMIKIIEEKLILVEEALCARLEISREIGVFPFVQNEIAKKTSENT